MNGRCVPANRWDHLLPADDEMWSPSRLISICIPARDADLELARTLAGIRTQTYPPDLIEVVIVDDRSDPPLTIDAAGLRVQVFPAPPIDGFGAAAARNLAASHASGDLLVFLDADVIPAPRALEAMARWYERDLDVVVLPEVRFVDMDGDAEWVSRCLGERGEDAFDDLEIPGQEWRTPFLRRTDDLLIDEVDNFRVVTSAALAVHREQFATVGGFETVPVRGVDDVEFGYRLAVNGAILVPDRAARVWHQGGASMRGAARRDIARQRRPYLERLIPVGGFRSRPPHPDDPVAITPKLVVHFDRDAVGEQRWSEIVRHIERLDRTDVVVTSDMAPPTGPFTSAFAHVWLDPNLVWGPTTTSRLVGLLARPDVGCVRAVDDEGRELLAVTTRAVRRTARCLDDENVAASAGALFGTWWSSADRLGLASAHEAHSARWRPIDRLKALLQRRVAQAVEAARRRSPSTARPTPAPVSSGRPEGEA